ncbi:MAG: cirA 5 [Lacunisphaera sp.]|nr:cirA 5 [Lacunisphaera sp.]
MNVRAGWLALACAAAVARGQTVALEPVVVTAARAPQAAAQVPFSLVTFDGAGLRAAPAATLDDALRAVPGFSLFRRSDSLTANPTAQGVSLRGLGPSGASRSLVLLDGVPLNDPFGGWITWSKIPRESLAGAELVRGGGATAWGNAALGGVVQLLTATEVTSRLALTAGDFSTRSAELAIAQPLGSGTLRLSGRDFSTDGFPLVAPEDRGPIDLAASSQHHWLSARWSQPIGDGLQLALQARTFAERRGNGTPYQTNSSRENFGSLQLQSAPAAAFAWTATAYGQDQSFASTFSSVNATRTAETPASDQFAVPATALGAAWSGTWTGADGARTTLGGDLREVRGETREHFTFVNGAFTRLRVAGGKQDVAGLFVLREQPVAANLRATLGVRLDDWRESDGHRRESDLATDTASRDDHYADSDGLEFSPSAGLVWQATPAWRVRAAAQQAFRRPTLNELYRPFRAGSVVTEANAALRTERVTSGELGVDYTSHDLTLGAAAFWNELHDAVGNVTLARGPGTFPLFGTLPAGGIGRQRLNLDRLRVRGVELSAKWQPVTALTFNVSFLYDDAVVRRASVAPALEGKRLAQVPRQSATLGASWRAPGGLVLTPRLRWLGRQFEDDENLLLLGAAVVTDLGLSYPLSPCMELFLTLENLDNTRIETGRSTDGIVNTGNPRLVFGGVRAVW